MKTRIESLNAAYAAGTITRGEYAGRARNMLSALDWQSRMQYANMLYITIVF